MSLYREVHLKDQVEITDKKLGEVLKKEMRPVIKHEACYWRKFNALHKYFYDHFGNEGEDNCVNMHMDISDIKELLSLITKIKSNIKVKDGKIINPEVCEELPTEDGFLFGSTEYDEWYVSDLDLTIEQLTKVINDHEKLVELGVPEFDIDYYYWAWY